VEGRRLFHLNKPDIGGLKRALTTLPILGPRKGTKLKGLRKIERPGSRGSYVMENEDGGEGLSSGLEKETPLRKDREKRGGCMGPRVKDCKVLVLAKIVSRGHLPTPNQSTGRESWGGGGVATSGFKQKQPGKHAG